METPPRARGPGRSGPRRRTGCLTCRARKVRCDEAKPTCANCTRLRLQCAYKNVIIPGLRAPAAASAQGRARSSSSATVDMEMETIMEQQQGREGEEFSSARNANPVVNLNLNKSRSEVPHFPTQQHPALPPASEGQSMDFPIPFDMLSFIGEITSDLQQKHLDLTNGGTVASAAAMPVPEIDRGLFHNERQIPWDSEEVDTVGILSEPEPEPLQGSSREEVWEEELLEHFRDSRPPPTIFGPIDLEWNHVSDVIINESTGCRALLLAVYCYSDMNKAWIDGTSWKLGPTYHAQASSEIQACLMGDVSERLLKRVFMSVLLLMLAELISRENWRPATPFLQTAYLLIQRFHNRTQSWTGLAHLIASWVFLLDIKSLIAGRDGDPLADLASLTPSSNETTPSSNTTSPDNDLPTPSPTYLITQTITSPAFTFFLATQQLTRRIITIDLHHRSRGTVSDEFEVLQIAHTVSGDLEALWNKRPKILELYTSTPADEECLLESLSPTLARSIVRTFRSYVANFLALFVYLHRVAFAIYPRTDRVYRAVDQIIFLAREESCCSTSSSSTSTSSSNNKINPDSEPSSIPISLIWPLFIAALEGSIEQRRWIISEMQRMAALGPGKGRERGMVHPNIRKALVLLEEMTRRQGKSRTWADSRCVRRELFVDFFVMI